MGVCYEDKKIKETDPSAPKHNYSCCYKKKDNREVFESCKVRCYKKEKRKKKKEKRKITEWDLNQGPPAPNK